MEKVKLTPKQAESLEYLKRNFRLKEIVILHVQKYGCDWVGKGEGINGLDVDALIKALYIGYEIEESFKIGDWVVYKDKICKVISTSSDHRPLYLDNGIVGWVAIEDVRKATPEEIAAEKERRKWAAIGRKVNEYRKGDFVKVKGEEFYGVIERPLGNGGMLQEIKERVGRLVNFETASDDDLYYMSKGHINWLIKRAEEAEKLTRIAIEADEGCEYWKERFQQAQAKAERYEKALKEIAEWSGIASREYRIATKALEGKRMSDKEREEFVCEHCGKELDENNEYHTTFRTCNEDCYMKMVGLSWGDFISHYY